MSESCLIIHRFIDLIVVEAFGEGTRILRAVAIRPECVLASALIDSAPFVIFIIGSAAAEFNSDIFSALV